MSGCHYNFLNHFECVRRGGAVSGVTNRSSLAAAGDRGTQHAVRVRNAVSYWPRCEPDVAVAYLPVVPVLTRRLACCAESFPQRRRAQKVDCIGFREKFAIARVLCQPFQKREQSVRLRHELVGHDRHSTLRIMSSPSFWWNRFVRMKIDYRVDRSSTTDSEATYPNPGNTFPGQGDVEYLFLEEDSTTYVAAYTSWADVQGRLETDGDDQDRDQAHAGGAYRYEEGTLAVVSVDRQQCFAEAAVPCECCCGTIGGQPQHDCDCCPHFGSSCWDADTRTAVAIVTKSDVPVRSKVPKTRTPKRGSGDDEQRNRAACRTECDLEVVRSDRVLDECEAHASCDKQRNRQN